MKNNFETCLTQTLLWEGGYSNHPKDPGGATNYGVIQTRYDEYRNDIGKNKRSVKEITKQERDDIYKKYYWDKVSGDELPSGVDLCVFDYGVNSGPYRSIKHLQYVLGLDADGVLGPITMKGIHEIPADVLISALCDKRMSFLKGLSIWTTFGKGWTRRVVGIRKYSLSLVGTKVVAVNSIQVFIKWLLSLLSS